MIGLKHAIELFKKNETKKKIVSGDFQLDWVRVCVCVCAYVT